MSGEQGGEQDVYEQVEAALDALNIGPGPTRDALMKGVREALDLAMREIGLDEEPGVVVLDGGKAVATDVPATDKPELRVVEDEDEADDDDVRPAVEVRVVRTGAQSLLDPLDLLGDGVIRVGPRNGDGPWQTIYRGVQPWPYRLAADVGALEVALDGELVEMLVPGHTLDVEGTNVRVRSVEAASRGRYVRLGD